VQHPWATAYAGHRAARLNNKVNFVLIAKVERSAASGEWGPPAGGGQDVLLSSTTATLTTIFCAKMKMDKRSRLSAYSPLTRNGKNLFTYTTEMSRAWAPSRYRSVFRPSRHLYDFSGGTRQNWMPKTFLLISSDVESIQNHRM